MLIIDLVRWPCVWYAGPPIEGQVNLQESYRAKRPDVTKEIIMDLNQRESMELLINICHEHGNRLHRQAELYCFKRDAARQHSDQAAADKWQKFVTYYQGLEEETIIAACEIRNDFNDIHYIEPTWTAPGAKKVATVSTKQHHDDGPQLDLLAEFWKS